MAVRTKVAPQKEAPEVMDDGIPVLAVVPYIDETKGFEVRGNYEVLEKALRDRRDAMLKLKISAKDMDTVAKFKREAQGYRIMLSGIEKDVKTRYFNAPKDVFAGKIAALQAIVADIEAKADKVLQAEEDRRIKALNQVFDIYVSDLQERYGLSEDSLSKLEFKKSYYNKTAKEAETKADLEAQFTALKGAETARAAGEKLIRQACKGNMYLDVERFVRLLDTTELGNIMEMIEADQKRIREADVSKDEPPETPQAVEEEPENGVIVDPETVLPSEGFSVGVAAMAGSFFGSGSDFPGRTRKMTVEIEYPVDLGDGLTSLFDELRKYGIVARSKKAVF